MRIAGDGGVELSVDLWGEPGEESVVLLHGGGQTRHAWRNAAAILAGHGFQVAACDLRGHGDSQWCPQGRYELETFARDIVEVVDFLGGRAALVGASLGGLSVLVCEGELRMQRASSVVLVDVTPRLDPDGVRKIVGFMLAHPDGFASLDEAAAAVAAYLPHRPRREDSSGLARNLRQGEDGRWRWHWDPRFLQPGPRSGDEGFEQRMIRAAGNLDVPTLLVRGAMSELVSEEAAREFLAAVPHAEYVDVHGAAHMVAGDRNDAFADAVVEFLLRNLSPAA
jgi:pimeloyl-ACP methyl ester carboxylesterase